MKKLIFLISFCFIFLSNIQSQDCSIMTISNNTSLSLDGNGEAVVIPEMLMFGDISQCNYEIGLAINNGNGNFTIVIPYAPSITITCEFIGTYVVTVKDLDSGNTIWANLVIEDKIGACSTSFGPDTYSLVYSSRNISGLIDTDVTLNGNLVDEVYDWLDTIPKSDLVDGENVLNFPTSNTQLNGITTLDIVEASKMFAVDPVFPLRAVLADMDGSGYLNINDIIVLRNLVLDLPNPDLADSHLFVSKTYEFPSDFNAFDFTDLNFREYTFDKDDVTQDDLEFFVYQLGNIVGNGLEITDSIANDDVSNRSVKKLILADKDVVAGETILVPMTLVSEDFDIRGLQLGMALNGLQLRDVDHNYTGNTLMYNYISDQDLRFSFMDQEGSSEFNIVLEFEVMENGALSDMILLDMDFEQLAVGEDQHSLINLDFQAISSTMELEELSMSMIGNELQIVLPDNHKNAIVIYDVQGKVLYTVIPTSTLVSVNMSEYYGGMFFVSTIVNGKPATRKMVLFNH